MKRYLLKVNKSERDSILEMHNTQQPIWGKTKINESIRSEYEGMTTHYGQNNSTPLFVEDFAADKKGITVNNKGDVMEYRNTEINEKKKKCKKCGLNEEVCKCGKKKGKPTKCKKCGLNEEVCECGTMNEMDEIDGFTGKFDYTESDHMSLDESINKSLNMFKRIRVI